ncbi:ATP-dependent DNA helicase RecG [bacterium]|nr:ATP-dependent DNA helicase RecG [bacterium]
MSSVKKEDKAPWELQAQYLKGVGAKLAELLEKAGINSFWDILFHLPRTYEDRRHMASYADIIKASGLGESVMSKATIEAYVQKKAGRSGRGWLEAVAVIEDDDPKPSAFKRVTFVWFHNYAQHLKKQFPVGTSVIFHGKVQAFRGTFQITHPNFQKTQKEMTPWEFGGYIPVYPETMGISTRVFRRILYHAIHRPEMKDVPEKLPARLVEKLNLCTLKESLKQLHFPTQWEPIDEESFSTNQFYKRVAFEELFYVSLALGIRKHVYREERENSEREVPKVTLDEKTTKQRISTLPFPLTGDQSKSLNEIFQDMSLQEKSGPMHRLLQGDVGSGKTVVAFLSMLAAVDQGYQAVLMAPTEILADQHFRNFLKLFPEYENELLLLKGALSEKKKKEVRALISAGKGKVIIGTSALLSKEDLFERLGLVVVDEQHRFGVKQRLALKKASANSMPHFLVMTATPIPRSLALTLYGDLKLSQIREKPAGRTPIRTHLVSDRARKSLQRRLNDFLEEGRQIYMVYPLVDESEELALKDVKTAYAEWAKALPKFSFALLHGKMKSSEKEKVMRSFSEGKVDVLVATTVIEVGIDVPNASVIVVEHAERFGLSQLHQLRGRVGRGSQESYCVLVGSRNLSENAQYRLKVMEESDDGFFIAEKDLELRGPGEFLGSRQSGLPGFKVAHILRDLKLLEVARDEANLILEKDPQLTAPENAELKENLMRWWGDRLELGLSG